MKKRHFAAGLLGLVVLAGGVTAYTLMPTVHPGSPTELPEFGRTGSHRIATRERVITLAPRPLIEASSLVTGNLDEQPRTLTLRLWYPTATTEGDSAVYERDLSRDAEHPLPVRFQGIALDAGEPIPGRRFPLVVMSHGYGGFAEHFSFLGEHIASYGYVVASINHEDARPDGAVSFLLSFGNVLQNRALDQREAIRYLQKSASEATGGIDATIDPERIAVIGYSMGGYGAIATAGADYDYDGPALNNLPDRSKEVMQTDSETISAVKALVVLAPWGGAPDNRAWKGTDLKRISVPSLYIAGNQDDVVNFENGVRWLFNHSTGANRHLLVYREARHNIAGNAIPNPEFPANRDFATAEYMREPVWRTERINAINQHFITAFLELHLKGDATKAEYLVPPVADSNASSWPLAPGEQLNGTLAGPEQENHWRGFQRRWALGMELHTKHVGE